MLWTDRLKAYPIEWLLEPENPSVRYWALIDLMDRPVSDGEVAEAREAIMDSPPVRAILDAQDPEGHWGNPMDMYNPKYRATTHSLLVLAELGATRTPAIERAVEHMFLYQRDSGHFLIGVPKTAKGRASVVTDGCCIDGNILYYLNHFGYLGDPRTQRLVDFLVGDHAMEDAGWRCRAFPIDPAKVFPVNCYMGATKVLKAFSMISQNKRTAEMAKIIEREMENVVENGIYSYLRNPDVLEVLDPLTRLGVRDPRMEPAIDLVHGAQQGDGSWLLKHTFNGKMWHDIDVKHEPSKWITLRALRVLKRHHG